MKKAKVVLMIFFVGMLVSCAQVTNETSKLSEDILESARNISANSKGIVHLETSYGVKNNNIGNADIYLIHKKGGEWWIEQAKNAYPKMVYPHDWYIDNIYKKEKGSFYNNYNKWAFFIDKKYLEPKLESAEGGEFTSYYPKKNSNITMVLFEQKAGDKEWTAIDSITYKTDSEGNEVDTSNENGSYNLSAKWESNFIEEKVKESNK